jgi:hypothetical protein
MTGDSMKADPKGKEALLMREKFEKRIFEKPGETKRHEEYAEYLKSVGDPRGEFIELNIALEDKRMTREHHIYNEIRQREILAKHGRKWLGKLADFVLLKSQPGRDFELKPGCRLWWWRGWISGLQTDELTLKVTQVLLHAPELRFFSKLVIIDALNATCDYLHEWGLLDKIKELDLAYGRITDKGAMVLANDKSLKKLAALDLTGNQISEDAIAALKKSFPKVGIDEQHIPMVPGSLSRAAGGVPVPRAASDDEDEDE